MKRHKAFQTLSHDHHHGLVLAQIVKSGSPEYKGLPKTSAGKRDYTLRSFEENLVPHFKKEEEILFPLARNKRKEISELVDELIVDHQKIYLLIERVKNSNSVEEDLNELGKLLESHIRKEERELFQELQKVLSEDELDNLESDLGIASSSCKV